MTNWFLGAEDSKKASEYCAKAENAIQYLTNSESATVYALLAIYYQMSAMEQRNDSNANTNSANNYW